MSKLFELNGFSEQPICVGCKNYVSGIKCKAFDIIPDSILLEGNKHITPFIGQQNNIVFEQIEQPSGNEKQV